MLDTVCYRSILDSNPDGVLILDADGAVLEENERARELLGFDPKGKPIEVIMGNKAIQEGSLQVGNKKFLVKPFSLSCPKEENKQVLRFLTIKPLATEILSIKALDNAPTALTLIDLHGKRLWANKAFVKFTGKPIEELLGVPVELAYPVEERGRVRQALLDETVQKGGISNFETWFEKGGKRVWVKISTSLIRDESGNPSAIVYSADDITRIKQAHEEKESVLGSLYESIVELSPDAIVMATPDGHIRTANRATLEMLGRADRVFEWIDLEDQEKHKGWVEDIVKKGHGSCPGHEVALRARNGEVHNVILHHGLSRFLEDDSPCVILYIKDITELKIQQDYVNGLLKLIPIGMFTFDLETAQIFSANPLLLELLGYKEEDFLQKTFFELLPKELHEQAEALIQKALETGEKSWVRWPMLKKDGTRLPVMISYGKVYDPCIKKDTMAVFIVDVSESERAKAKAELLLKLSPVGICEWRPGGELLEINDQYAAIVGYTKEEVFKMGWKNLTAPEYQGDPDRLHEENALKGIDKTYRKEYIHKDGHRVPIYLITEPIFDEQGNLDRYISYVQDLTAVLENERLIQAILDTVPVGVAIADKDGHLYLVNRAYSQMTGRAVEEVMKKGWIPLTAQEDVEKTRKAIERVCSGTSKEEIIEKSYTTEGGTRRFVKAVYRPIEYKGKRMALYAGMDITELRGAKEKLQELVEAQQQTIKELSTPLIPVWSKVLMAPLLGSFDSMRMHDLSERLLEYVASQKPKAVLLDLTGLAHVDTQVISEIVRLIASLRLLGSRAILVGIKPHVAQSLVRLGASLEGVPTHATLEQGLRGLIGDAGHAKR